MGVVRFQEEKGETVKTFKKMGILWERDNRGLELDFGRSRKGVSWRKRIPSAEMDGGAAEGAQQRMPVCVTSGAFYIGWDIADRLSRRGYAVRLLVDEEEDLAALEETYSLREKEPRRIFPVVANMTETSSLREAFDGCAGVFHTSAFLDPAGLSGYTKYMAEKEAAVAGKVAEVCASTPSVKRFVFTSSLLACIWRRRDGLVPRSAPVLVDETWWSDESFCADKKLWLALGKTMAEKAVWAAARGRGLKIATICPALVTGGGFCASNTTASIAYLKGGREMYAEGLLATAAVEAAAEAHVSVYEAMSNGAAAGRYICFDRVVRGDDQAAEICRQAGLADGFAGGEGDAPRFLLSNDKLRRLLSAGRCSA